MRGYKKPALLGNCGHLFLRPSVQFIELSVIGGCVGRVNRPPIRVYYGQPRGDVVDSELHTERVEPEMRVMDAVPVPFVLIFALRCQVFDFLYGLSGVKLPGFNLRDDFHDHFRQVGPFFFAFFFGPFGRLDGFLNLHQPIFSTNLAILHLLDDITNFQEGSYPFAMRFTEINRVNYLCQFYDGRFVASRVLQQFTEPRILQSQADAQHDFGVGDCGDVLCAGLESVWV